MAALHTERTAAGCIVYRYEQADTPLILLIHDRYGHWTLPKGHLKTGETAETAAIREVREETGLVGTLGSKVAQISYPIIKRGETLEKRVTFFLLRADHGTPTPQADEGISALGWFAPADALARIGYPQIRDVLARALPLVDRA